MVRTNVRLLRPGLIAALFVLVAVASIQAQDVLTNQSVIKMVEAGLPESVIVAKIRSSQTNFDVTTEELIALKKAGVSDGILAAMVQPKGDTKPAEETLAIPGSTLKDARVIYHVIGDKPTALSPVPAEKRRSAEGYQGGIANPWGTKRIKADFVLPGAKALYRIAERQPVFLVRSFPEGSGTILRLTPKADERSITITVVSFKIAMIPGPTGPREEDAVKIDLKMDRGGTFRIVPKQPLEPGEYAYVVGAAQGNPIFFFEFGID